MADLQIEGCNWTVGLKIATLFDSYNLCFEARDSSPLTTKLAIWYFSVSSPWSVFHPCSQNETKYVNTRRRQLDDCQSWDLFLHKVNAFRKTFLQEAKRKTRKLTDHRKQLPSRALISSGIVLSHENENCGKWSQLVVFVVGPREEDEERCRQHYKHMILGFISV